MRVKLLSILFVCTAMAAAPAAAQGNPCNPCNPCGAKAKNPCNPCNPCGGKATAMKLPAVNPCFAKLGTVFYVADPMARNTVTFTSEAPLEDIVGTSNKVVGYVVFDPEEPSKGARGYFEVPVKSLDTGIPLRDEHLHSSMWLDAANHPKVTFRIEDSKYAFPVKYGDTFKTFKVTLVGPFTVNGVTQRMEIPARLTWLKESSKTQQKMPGDLLGIRAEFDVALSDFNITGPKGQELVGSRVGDTIACEVSLFASDEKPSMAANPCNPCNPCGGKAMNPCNPCNPCGGKAKNPCNPCNPCGGKAKNPCNPCNPCGGK